MNEDRPALSARELLRIEGSFQRCIDYVDIAGRSYTGSRFSELRAIYQGCRALTFALARLSDSWLMIPICCYDVRLSID